MNKSILILTSLLAWLLAACAPLLTATPAPTPFMPMPTQAPAIPVTGVAIVQNVAIQVQGSQPLQVTVLVRGQLPDSGCTSIAAIDQVRDGNTIRVTLATTTDPLALCAQALTAFERTLSLDVSQLPAARYTVNVNGVEAAFELLTRDLGAFKVSLVEALNARNYDLLKLMMSESFTIGSWRSEGTDLPADQAIEQLRLNLLNSTTPITADFPRNLIELLGSDPATLLGPGVMEVSPLLVSGLGAQGKAEAILFVARLADGSLYWHGLLFAQDGFATPPATPIVTQPVDTTAYPTSVQYVLARKDVRLRSGPGTQFEVLGWVAAGQTAKVTGISADGAWWRVICPNDTVGSCWISADPSLTQPANQPAPDTTVYPASVQYVMAQRDVTIYSGPGTQYNALGAVAAGQIAAVTGINANGTWWRVMCPNDTVGSCWVSADPNDTRPTENAGKADVQSVEIQIPDSYPLQVNAVARGLLPDAGCTSLGKITKARAGNVFTIILIIKTNAQAYCPQVLTPFEQVISLDVSALLPGIYRVLVNGVEASFVLPEVQQPTNVQYVMAQRDVSIYSGAGPEYNAVGFLAAGQIARVTGVSTSGSWWRVICPDNSTGSCWVSANPADTQPTPAP